MSTITSGYIHLLLTNRQKLHCICLYYTSSGSIFHSTINLQSWFTLVIHNILNTEHQWIRWFPQLTFYGHCRNTEIMITMHRHKKITIKTTWPPCSTLSNTSNKLLTTECHLTDIQEFKRQIMITKHWSTPRLFICSWYHNLLKGLAVGKNGCTSFQDLLKLLLGIKCYCLHPFNRIHHKMQTYLPLLLWWSSILLPFLLQCLLLGFFLLCLQLLRILLRSSRQTIVSTCSNPTNLENCFVSNLAKLK